MRKLAGLLAVVALTMSMAPIPGAQAGPGPHGVTSDTVEHVDFIPFEVGTATGANFFSKGKDDYMVITSWQDFSIYDINDPEAPALVGDPVPFGFKFENEDVATERQDHAVLRVAPARPSPHLGHRGQVTNPVEIAVLDGAGDHTTSCILKCKWAYGSEGAITDLRNPAKPKLMDEKWGDGASPPNSTGHDVTEFENGIVMTSTNPIHDPRRTQGPGSRRRSWPTAPPDPRGLGCSTRACGRTRRQGQVRRSPGGETCCGGEQCDRTHGRFMTWDTKGGRRPRRSSLVDTVAASERHVSSMAESSPVHRSVARLTGSRRTRRGRTVASSPSVGTTSGTRFLDVDPKGKIKEVGWFLPNGGSTSAAYWVTRRDRVRGRLHPRHRHPEVHRQVLDPTERSEQEGPACAGGPFSLPRPGGAGLAALGANRMQDT